MAVLTTARRNKLPKSQFALPGKDGYPIDTAGRARNALSRASQFASPSQQAQIRSRVARAYPGIKQSKGAAAKKKNANGANGAAGRNGNGDRTGGNPNRRIAQRLENRLAERDQERRR